MDQSTPTPPAPDRQDLASLEETTTVVQTDPVQAAPADAGSTLDATTPAGSPVNSAPESKPPLKTRLRIRLQHFNIYLLLFMLLFLVAIIVTIVTYTTSKKDANTTLSSSSLSQDTLNQLAASDATVGSSNQVLNVQSSAIFAGKVLARSSLAVAGDLDVGGKLSLGGLNVSGSGLFNSLQVAQDLAITGDSSIQGQLSVQHNLTVNGNGNFGGSLTANQITAFGLQLNGDLNLTHHLSAGGATPSRSNGSALGSGGTASVSGSDTSGTLTINTGGSPAAGCFATLTFATQFNATPHVIITPIGSAAAGLSYYVNRSPSNFSICTTTAAPSGSNFAFDYLVLD